VKHKAIKALVKNNRDFNGKRL